MRDFEKMLDYLAQYGKPRVVRTDGGWVCTVDVYVQPKGVTFDIKSEFGHATARAALEQCCDRGGETLTGLIDRRLPAPKP